MNIQVKIVTWVNPIHLPPVLQLIHILQSKGITPHLITTHHNKLKLDGIQIDTVDFNGKSHVIKRLLSRIKFLLTILRGNNGDKVIVFDNMSYLFCSLRYTSKNVYYNIIELFDVSNRIFFRSPVDSVFSFLSILLIKKARTNHFSLPSHQRLEWFCTKYSIAPKKFQVVLNAPIVSRSELSKKDIVSDEPVILHSGGVNHTRSVLELIKGFNLLTIPAKLRITNIVDSKYCEEVVDSVNKSPKKDKIKLLPFLTRNEYDLELSKAQIGVVFMKNNNFDSVNIAPNKLGEYLKNGLICCVTPNKYYEAFNPTSIIIETSSLSPEGVSECLEKALKVYAKNSHNQDFAKILKWYNAETQLKPILDFIH